MERLHELLRRRCILFDANLVSSSSKTPGGLEKTMEEFKRQLLTYQEIKVLPEDPLVCVT